MDQSSVTVTLYKYDALGIFVEAVEVHPMGEVPPALMVPPPLLTGNEVAQAKGNEWVVLPAYPADAPTPVPRQVPMLNARLALIMQGHMSNVDAVLAASPNVEGEMARAFFEFAQNVRRDHWVVEALRAALNLTEADIDNLFILALTLE